MALSARWRMLWGMRVLLVLEVDIDEGLRPSTRFRRVDAVARSLGVAADRVRHVRLVKSVRVCDPSEVGELAELVSYDGAQFTAPLGVAVSL